MAQGDQSDFLSRLQAQLPRGWFANDAPIRDGVLSGVANAFAWIWSQIQFTKLQTRVATATGFFLDIISNDYFGPTGLIRRAGEGDNAYRARIEANLLLPRGTRAAVINVIKLLTGIAPTIFEPANPADTGGYGHAGMTAGTGLYYNFAGGYGSLELPCQSFVTVTRGPQGGIANVAGYGNIAAGIYGQGGYGIGAIEYGSETMVDGLIQDSDIYAAVANTIPAGTIAWTRLVNPSA